MTTFSGRWRPLLLSFSLCMLACGKGNDSGESKSSTVSQAAPSPAPSTTRPLDANCPATGMWAVCSIEKRLKQAGFVAQKNDSVVDQRKGFSIPPVTYTLNRSRLELYIYSDPVALQREIARVDTSSVAPFFIRSGNLAALLFTDDATQAERVSLALTAGAPQRQP